MIERRKTGRRVAIAATLDTKTAEIDFVCKEIAARGFEVVLIDCGVLGEPGLRATVTREAVARAGGGDIAALRGQRNREKALPVMIAGLQAELRRMLETDGIAGYFGIGGGTNAALAAAAFEVMPFGMPKMLVTTVASGNTRPFVGMKDVALVHSVVDVLGLNAYLRDVVRQSTAAFCAMVDVFERGGRAETAGTACIGLTAFGSTTEAAAAIERRLTGEGAEVLTFHARGIGGMAMEEFVREGRITAVLDLTTTEVADEIVGGICSAGPLRLRAAAEAGIPQVVLPGAVDMVNFGPRSSVPARFDRRRFVSHTPHATLMRTTPDENRAIARFIASRLNEAGGPVRVVLPLRGFSAYDIEDGPFWDPEADDAFRDELRRSLKPEIPVQPVDAHINAPECVEAACAALAEAGGLTSET